MSIPTIGWIAFAAAACLFFVRPAWLFYAAVFFAPFSGTAVANLPSFGFQIALLFFVTFIGAALVGRPIGMGVHLARAQFLLLALLLAFYVVALDSLWTPAVAGHLSAHSVPIMTFMGVGVVTTWTVALFVDSEQKLISALKVQMASATFVSLWGVLQIMCAIVGVRYPTFFNTSASHSADLYGTFTDEGYVRLGSVAVEPSILVQSLAFPLCVASTYLVLNARVIRSWCAVATLTSVICILLATSTTGYLGLAVLAGLLVLERPAAAATHLGPWLVAIVLAVVLVPHLSSAILETTLFKADTWSYQHRLADVQEGFDAFMQHPLLGVGLTKNFFSLPVFLLANTGIFGAVLFCILILALVFVASRRRTTPRQPPRSGDDAIASAALGPICVGLRNALIVSIAMQTAAGFTYAFRDLWIAIGLTIAAIGLRPDASARSNLDAASPSGHVSDQAEPSRLKSADRFG